MHATVCDYIADLVHNAVEAGATCIGLDAAMDPAQITVTVTDNGCGMDPAQLLRAEDPFYSTPGKHDKRRVGLGLPLLRQATESTGGRLELRSEPGQGTTVLFQLNVQHIDTPPLGDLAGTLATLLALPGEYDLAVRRRSATGDYAITRQELIATLGNLENALNFRLAREFLAALEQELAPQSHTRAA